MSAEAMQTVILCGGQGTRLREETERIPKPLVDIGGRPILWHLMKIYDHYRFRRFILCLGYKSWDIKEYFLRYKEHLSDFTLRLDDDHKPRFNDRLGDEEWEVTCAETGLLTASGARLWMVRDYIEQDTFLFTYGDGLASLDISELLRFHRQHGRIGTITGVHPSSRYGEMRVDGDVVTEFNEKPTQLADFVSGGFFVFERGIFDYLHDDPQLVFEQEPLQNLARDGQLAVFRHEGFWLGMDTHRDFVELNRLWRDGDAPWKKWVI